MSPRTRALIQQSRELIEQSRVLIETSREIVRGSTLIWSGCQMTMQKRRKMAAEYPKNVGEIRDYLTAAC